MLEQRVAPLERRQQRLLPRFGVRAGQGQGAEALVELREDGRCTSIDKPRRREFEGQRRTVRAPAELAECRRITID